jgi:hypothetical protein
MLSARDAKQNRVLIFIIDRKKRTQSNVFRVESAQSKVPCIKLSIFFFLIARRELTYHTPKTWNPYVTPCTLYLAVGVQPPDWLEAGASLGSEYIAHRGSRFSKTAHMCHETRSPSPPWEQKQKQKPDPPTRSRKSQRLHRAYSHPQTLDLSQ